MNEHTDTKLLPCPAGCVPAIIEIPPHKHSITQMPDHPGSWTIECGCGWGLIDEDKERLIKRWNTRTPEARPDGWIPNVVDTQMMRDKILNLMEDKEDNLYGAAWNDAIRKVISVIKNEEARLQPPATEQAQEKE